MRPRGRRKSREKLLRRQRRPGGEVVRTAFPTMEGPPQLTRNEKMSAGKPQRRDGHGEAKPQPKTLSTTDDTDYTDREETKSLRAKSWGIFPSMSSSSMILSLPLTRILPDPYSLVMTTALSAWRNLPLFAALLSGAGVWPATGASRPSAFAGETPAVAGQRPAQLHLQTARRQIEPFDYAGVTIDGGLLRTQIDEVVRFYLAIP